MKIRLDEARVQPIEWDETLLVPVGELGGIDELVVLGPVIWRGRVVEVEGGFFLRARLEASQGLRCDRCLTEFERDLEGDVELLVVIDEPPEDDEIELRADDLGILYHDGEEFDTWPLLIEHLTLGVPMQPLCRDDCRGLCARCGEDLNDGTCDCGQEEPDPRWAALAQLKDRLSN
ncbi:MAG: DUF177 domain-containing protein [Acidobacteriota bacterium]